MDSAGARNIINNMAIKPRQAVRAAITIRVMETAENFSESDLEDSAGVFYSNRSDRDENSQESWWMSCLRKFKIIVFVCLWVICACALMTNNVKVHNMHQLSVPQGFTKSYLIWEEPIDNKLHVNVQGAFIPRYYENLSVHWMTVWVQLLVLREAPVSHSSSGLTQIKPSKILLVQNVSEAWEVPVVSEKLVGLVPELNYKKTFHLNSIKVGKSSHSLLEIQFATDLKTNFPVLMGYNLQPINTDLGIVYAALILMGLYVLIVFDLVHRTLAAILASTMSVAILAALNARPTMAEIISWIDVETLLLLFSMMTLVTIFSETGIFDYMAVMAYRITQGKPWPLINILCVISVILSCFLDNVTTTLLVTPVTIKLCEVMQLNPVPILIYMLIFSNIGGAITPIGDPPNVIIASNPQVVASGINFGVFTMHMGLGVIIVSTVVYIQLRYTHRDIKFFKYPEPQKVQELKREIGLLKRTVASVSSYSIEEETIKGSLMKHLTDRLEQLQEARNANLDTATTNSNESDYTETLKELQKKYPIKDKVLLIKSGITLGLVICVFFLHSIPAMSILGLGWTALLGALLLLLLYDKDSIEGIFCRVEWSTLLFFASLFILMEALARLGLIEWVGVQTRTLIMSVGQESRLTVALILMLWVSGVASAFVDNLPLTTMMIRIATNLSENREVGLPLPPLVWALSFGACLGGNGTLFGSSSNIVCAGVAEQHGHKFTFLRFTKIGFPVMITSMVVTTLYLIVCHIFLSWH